MKKKTAKLSKFIKDKKSESGWKIVWGTNKEGHSVHPDVCPLCGGKLHATIPAEYCAEFDIDGDNLRPREDSGDVQFIWELVTYVCGRELTPPKARKKKWCDFEHEEVSG